MQHPLFISFVALLSATACRGVEENQPPVADASGPETVAVGTWVQLDGSGSSDPEGTPLNRRWTFVRLPVGSAATLNDTAVENPSFLADEPGEYVVRLVVDDGYLRSQPDAVTVTATPINRAPVAHAGMDRNVVTGADVLLDGTASTDADGDDLTYAWDFVSKPSGSTAAFDDATSATPTFRADLDGAYQVRLIVSDGAAQSAPAIVQVNASADNLAPIADAGVDQYVPVGSETTLDGGASYDPNGSELTWSWTFTDRPTGSIATITQDGGAVATFTPDVAGTYAIALVVDDGEVTSAPDRVEVVAYTENGRPVADAGANDSAATGFPYQLDGRDSSDPDGDLLAFSWRFTSLPAGSQATLNDPSVVRPTFVPDVDGAYALRLDVWDGLLWSTPATVTIAATGANRPPVADPGADATVAAGALVALDGAASFDPDGDPLTYAWRFVAVPPGFVGGLNDEAVVNPSFTATVEGEYVLALEVGDGALWSATATVTITATTGNLPPTADAGADQVVDTGSVVALTGAASSDPDLDPLTYAWAFTSKPAGSTAALNDPALVSPSFVTDRDGDYVLRLVVSDGALTSPPATVVITAGNANQAPVANAGPDRPTETTGVTLQVDGSLSADPEGAPLTWQWSFASLPAGSQATLNATNVMSPSFTPDVDGDYTVRLVVSDGVLTSAPDFATITTTGGNRAPTADAGEDQTVTAPVTVQVSGALSFDLDGDDLSFHWSLYRLPAGSSATLNDPTVINPSFFADRPGLYELRLRVSDGAASSDYAYVVVNAQ